ncbi:uncharacterized protein LOC8042509 [Ixodes scapularis]|uniref:uncharacterized protein LOC8042509 n=1 Tax=Ixodes scapularis TaxID=6945 RepID=UPI001A9DBFBF|nr:uncharacterized protein LOC8042509 [Ixodes scapularis]XP_029847839.2 uncharacterized protein LOC8042509 [Ixodes scapularis]
MESCEGLPWPRCMSWLLCLSWDEADMDSGRAELSLHVGSAQGAAAAPPPPDTSMNLQDDLQAGRPVFFRVDLRSAAHEEGCGTPAAAGQTRAPGDENASDGAATKPSEERRPNRERRSKEEPQLPLGVYMACLSLNKVGHCHPKGRCCCGSSNVTAASSSPPTPRDVGSVKTLRSRCSHTEASNYTLVLKPKAVKPRAAGSAQSVPSASAGVEVERPDVASRPGSTPSQFLGSEEGDLSLRAQRPPYSSPNSPVLFTQVQRQSSSPATCENCQRSRSATVESEWQQRRGERKEKPRRRDRNERCCSEEITALSCGEDADDSAMSRPGCAAKKGSRYSLGSCLGSRGQRAFKTGEHRRRFSLTLPSALLNLFRRRRGSSPSVRNSASQTEPYLGEAVCYGAQASGSPYAVRALPPLPAGCSSVCDRLSAASDAASTTSDESDRRSMDYAASIEKVKDCGWYWGPISGETAERLLSQEPDGSFVVRDSSDEHYIFSLTFKLNGLVRHVRIEHDQGNFSFGCLQKFQSHTIVDFIENAVEHSRSGRYLFFLHRRPILGPMRVQLLHPVSRFKQVQSLQHLCRFSILKSIRRDLIDSLPLPARLRAYLNTPHYYSEELADLAHPAFASHAFPATLVRDQSLEALFHQS